MGYEGGKTVIECPFCKKSGVAAFHWPRRRQAHVSRISNKSATIYEIKEETYDILSDCPNCGKTQKDIDNYYDGKTEIPHEVRIKRIKDSGLPTVIHDTEKHTDDD